MVSTDNKLDFQSQLFAAVKLLRMEMKDILEKIDAEIQRLEQVRALLAGNDGHDETKATAAGRKKRRLSPEARERIAAAQKTRWAKVKKASK